MPARKPKPKAKAAGWQPPEGLRIDVAVTRGDVCFRSEATPAEALNVAKLLTALAREMTKAAPDLLPHADTVPGSSTTYFDDGDFEGQRARPPRVGF